MNKWTPEDWWTDTKGWVTKMLHILDLPTLQNQCKQCLSFFYKVVEGLVPAMQINELLLPAHKRQIIRPTKVQVLTVKPELQTFPCAPLKYWAAQKLLFHPKIRNRTRPRALMQPGESYRRRLRSLLYSCYVFWALINSLVCCFLFHPHHHWLEPPPWQSGESSHSWGLQTTDCHPKLHLTPTCHSCQPLLGVNLSPVFVNLSFPYAGQGLLFFRWWQRHFEFQWHAWQWNEKATLC